MFPELVFLVCVSRFLVVSSRCSVGVFNFKIFGGCLQDLGPLHWTPPLRHSAPSPGPPPLLDDLCRTAQNFALLHTPIRELQTCTFEGPGLENTTKIPPGDPQRERKRSKMRAGEGKKKRGASHDNEISSGREKKRTKFWAPTLRAPTSPGPHPSGPPPLRAPTPFGPPPPSGPPLRAPTTRPAHHLTKNKKLAKFGQIRLAKCGQLTLAKCGIGQIRFGQMRPNKDGQIRFGQIWPRPSPPPSLIFVSAGLPLRLTFFGWEEGFKTQSDQSPDPQKWVGNRNPPSAFTGSSWKNSMG